MTDSYKILCFTWNAAGLKICETMSQEAANKGRGGFLGMIGISKSCISPNFFEHIRDKIKEEAPKLIVITTQGEDESKTYFHSDFLPKTMQELHYSLLKRDKISNVGEPSSHIKYTDVETGNPSNTALRVSIYANSGSISELELEEKTFSDFFRNKSQSEGIFKQGDRAIGAIASYVKHKDKKMMFLSIHIPSGVKVLKVNNPTTYKTYRDIIKSGNKLVLHEIFDKLITPIPTNAQPNHIFILGDLNYDISNIQPVELLQQLITSKDYTKYYNDNDELKKEITSDGSSIFGFKEGINNKGPMFLPTWNLKRDRKELCSDITKINLNCYNTTNPYLSIGWHDRILYMDMEDKTTLETTKCTLYDRLDIMNINKSTHAGIIGIYNINK